jgi:hypothetical protein
MIPAQHEVCLAPAGTATNERPIACSLTGADVISRLKADFADKSFRTPIETRFAL